MTACPNGCDLAEYGGTHQGPPDCPLMPSRPDHPGQPLGELIAYLQGRRRDCLQALRCMTGESNQADYWRWQGHAELARQCLEQLGAEVPQ